MPSLFTREITASRPEAAAEAEPRGFSPRSLWSRYFPTRRKARRAIFYFLLLASSVFGSLVGLTLVYSTDLPQMEDLERYHPSTTTELLDIKGRPFGSFALERRVVVGYNEFPRSLRDAILSIEDKSFERNVGVNPFRAIGAAYIDMRSHGRRQGASTLTMQLARNLFLSAEQTWRRKLQEVLLSIQIERHFTKEQIFAMYANQIYLGHGTYGFEAGSQFYFSKHARDLTLSEAALLAALPKGPVLYSPLRHPERALRRRNLVLSEMLKDGRISQADYRAASATPIVLHIEPPAHTIAPYFVEEVRRQLESEYGTEAVHGTGMRVYTTLDLDLQIVANKSVLDGVAAYERRHGWKGNLVNVLATGGDLEVYKHPDWEESIETGSYLHAVVTEVSARHVIVRIGRRYAELLPGDWAWTQIWAGDKFLQRGDLVYVRIEDAASDGKTMHASLQQDSGAQASLMAVDNANGEILAMVGGRDFNLSQFNRATQAERQVGSSFKPYVYTAAVENGSKPTDNIVDGPTSFYTPNGPYTPHNYEANYRGSMSLLAAFAESRNIPALKLANQVGIRKVIEVAHRFGITSNIPAFLPVAIGSAGVSLAEQVGAYSVFPNDGIHIAPHAIRKIVQADGLPMHQTAPQVKEVISVETARTMMTFLKAVPQYGTAAQAGAVLKHPLGGKTGTTNNYTDAWFIGFSPSVTCGTWIGYDDRKSLGDKETGAKAALPMWIDFMKVVVARTPNEGFPSSNAPKRTLDVPLTAGKTDEKSASDATDDGEDSGADPDARSSPSKQPAAEPAPDTMPDDSAPAAPLGISPAQGGVSPRANQAATTNGAPRGLVVSPVGPYRPYTGPARAPSPPRPAATAPQP